MRVLLVDPSDRGGIRTYTAMVADGLVACGARVDVLTSGHGLPTQLWGRSPRAGLGFVARRLGYWLRAASAVYRATRRARPDIVHFQAALNRRFDAVLLRRLRRHARIVWTAHDVLPFERTAADARRFAEIYRTADAVIVHSAPAATALRELAGVEATVVAHPVPRDARRRPQAEARALLRLPSERRLLVAAGFVRPYKGYELLADVWDELGESAPHLLVVGEPLGADGKALVDRLRRCPHVTVRAGYCSDEEFRAAIEAADAVLLPYEEASDSGVLHLARALGVPVLASDAPQLAAVVEDTAAGRIVPRTRAAWREAVVGELPGRPPAPGRSLEDVGREHLGVYERVAAAASGVRPLRLLTYTDATGIGGAEQALGTLIRAFGPDVAVTVAGVDGSVVDFVAAHRPGAATTVLPLVRNKFDVLRIAANVRAVRRLAPDVLHAHLRHPWACQYGILAGIRAGVPVVAVEMATIGTHSDLQRRFKRWTSARLAAHVAFGERSARIVEADAGLPHGSIRPVYFGVEDLSVRARAPDGGPLRIGTLARLSPEKGLDDLIRALEWLPDVTLTLVGDGSERSRLERLTDELGLRERVTFAGWRADARAALAELDVLVLPSRSEALPLVLVEAMLAELPVVATDVGSVSEAVEDGVTGIILPSGSPRAIAEAVGGLRDPERRRKLGRAGRARALERFSAAGAARTFEALYEEVRR